jgi:hypothetical protein
MDRIQDLERFLQGAARSAQARRAAAVKSGPFITISRQTGAGGHSLAEALLTELARREGPAAEPWRIVDQEICRRLSTSPHLRVSLDLLLQESYRGPWEDAFMGVIAGLSPQRAILRRTFEIMRGLAAAGKVIIIGRAGACATRGLEGGIHLRLVSSPAARVARTMARFQLDRAEAQRMIEDQDAARTRLVRDYFHRDIADPMLYDAVLNSDRMEMREMSRVVGELLQERCGKEVPC